MKDTPIYLIIEFGNGDIHDAFTSREAANEAVLILEESTGMNCFEILQITLHS